MHILETSRLILRPPSHSDDLLLHGLHSDPFVVNAIRDGVYPTIEQSKAALIQFINHWKRNSFGLWMVFVKDEGQTRRFAGYSGLICSGTYPPEDANHVAEDPNNVEMVTCLHLAASGEGIAVEAGRAVVQFAFENLKLDRVNGFIRPNNTRSIIKNMKLGFVYVGDVTYKNSRRRLHLEVSPMTAVKPDNVLIYSCRYPENTIN
ncbi:GNAT family N-acetyltransferase [Mesorhizobium sp. LNJC391B00]|uniref:GNAT family N-acetyltransferase n=1 Tax=Mesorhizobium sp. LNJC391B00 TaxID=1287273 RepID=UPI0009FE1500|nr:GNAT family N-acetyltransferase [Mesorhizobium sp. LNJC391B00]